MSILGDVLYVELLTFFIQFCAACILYQMFAAKLEIDPISLFIKWRNREGEHGLTETA